MELVCKWLFKRNIIGDLRTWIYLDDKQNWCQNAFSSYNKRPMMRSTLLAQRQENHRFQIWNRHSISIHCDCLPLLWIETIRHFDLNSKDILIIAHRNFIHKSETESLTSFVDGGQLLKNCRDSSALKICHQNGV